MKFFFPDSQDFVDASFDFRLETRSPIRIRQLDVLYPHEILSQPPYDGILVSKAVVDGHGIESGKYSVAQRQRFLLYPQKKSPQFLRRKGAKSLWTVA